MSAPLWMLPRAAITADALRQLAVDRVEESQRLEFKAEAWSDLDELRKDVVGALNGGGALLLVGVKEDDHRASAVPGIEGAEAEAVRIEQSINAGVQPYPLGLEVFPIDLSDGRGVVAVRCPSTSRIPFARSTKRQCRFFQRKGQEVLEMTLEEVRASFQSSERLATVRGREWDWALARAKDRASRATLVAQIRPALVAAEILDPLDERVRAVLRNPSRGQPDPSLASTLRPIASIQPSGNKLTIALHGLHIESNWTVDNNVPAFELDATRTGALTLITSLIQATDSRYRSAPPSALNPVSLITFPVSLASVARELFESLAIPGPFHVHLALVRVWDHKLTSSLPWDERRLLPVAQEWRPHSEPEDVVVPQMSVASLASGEHPFFASLHRLFQAFNWPGPPTGAFMEDGSVDPRLARWE